MEARGTPKKQQKHEDEKKRGPPLTPHLHFNGFWWKMGAKMEAKIQKEKG